jgi:predicted nucleic acid-binding protein
VIVVDTNVVAYLLFPGTHTDAARATLTRDPVWAAPPLWRGEFRNVLALYLRERLVSLARALDIQELAESLLAGREYAVDSRDVLNHAHDSRRSAYDCEFVAVAAALGVPLVTSDRQLVSSFPRIAVDIRDFGAGE